MSIEITVPVLPESVADALLLEWKKSVGDAVRRDEILVEVETDKIVLEVASPNDGVLREIVQEAGATVTAGEVIGRVAVGDVGDGDDAHVHVHDSGDGNTDTDTGDTGDTGDNDDDGDAMSPAVRNLVAAHGLNPADIPGTGRGGRVTKQDILEFIGNQVAPDEDAPQPTVTPSVTPAPTVTPSVTPAPTRTETREPMSRLRRTVAGRLLHAQQSAALLTTFNEVDMQPVMDLRARCKDDFEKTHGVRLGFMSFFVTAAVAALQKYPLVNAHIDGTDIVRHDYHDIGIAVASPRGLVVPVLRDCAHKSFAEIETQIRDYGARAGDGKLALSELTGGTFTITNGGVFGSLLSTPIVNPPQSAILGMHKIAERAVVVAGEIVARPMMYLALTYDHRIIDGQQAVGFLVAIKSLLEDPARMLLRLN